jgi:hypothetical protein
VGGPMKRNLILCGESLLSTLDAKVSLLIQRTKNLVHHNFVKVVGCVHHLSSPAYKQNKGCVTLSLALPFYIRKSILRQKKKTYYGNSNISPMQKYNLSKKNPLKETQNIVQDIIITLL